MFDFSVIHESVAKKQREGVNQTVSQAIRSKTLTSTAILMSPEPLSTMALEYLDALNSESGKPEISGEPKDLEPVLLVCVNPQDSIKIFRWGSKNIYGTNVPAPSTKMIEDKGPIAYVDNSFPTRYARNILRSRGFPIREVRSRGANSGAIVEWKWLMQEANKEDAPDELKLIRDELQPRVAEFEAKRNGSAAAPNKTKSAGPQPAHP